MENRSDIPPGTLYMLILKTLARRGALHGYGIAQHIQQVSEDVLQVEEGSLAATPLCSACWSKAGWRPTGNSRKTTAGRGSTSMWEPTHAGHSLRSAGDAA